MEKKFETATVNKAKKEGTSGKQTLFIIAVYLILFLSFPKAFLVIGVTAVACGLILGIHRALKRKESEDKHEGDRKDSF